MQPGIWQVPECPWLISYPSPLFDEIRLAVVDAFFSIPRGGAEIGGVLYGSHTESEVRISAFRPMECEHALGPTFLLSGKDLARLAAQLEGAAADPALRGLEAVGWYHSHTRSDIFLSEADLEIYNRFFPEPWQVALVLRPAGMKPTRAGFFFRGRQGAIQSSASYLEFVVGGAVEPPPQGNGRPRPAPAPQPVPVNRTPEPAPEPAPEPPAAPPPAAEATLPASLPAASAMLQRIETLPARAPSEAAPPIEMRPTEFVPPAYMIPQAQPPSRARLWIALALVAAALALIAYITADFWMRGAAGKGPYLHLQALDTQGQLRIQWDRGGPAAQDAQSGVLEITDGQATTAMPLDAVKIRAGSFQYARQSEMVEVHMTVRTTKGKSFEEFTSFIGQPPPAATAQDLDKQKRAAELAAEAERARGDLKKEELRSLELQRSLEQMRLLLRREEERKRVENQMPSPARPAPAASQTAANTNPAPPPQTPPPQPKPQAPPVAVSQAPPAVKPPAPAPERPPAAVERPAPQPAPTQTSSTSQTQSAPPQVSRPQPPVSRTQPPPVQTPAPQPARLPLSGKWIYSAGSASGSPFPPETITLNLTESGGQVRGIFSGRYRVPRGNRFSGRVTFSFEGPARAGSSKFPFTASDGMKGDIEIIRLPGRQDAIEVVWRSERDKLTFDDLYFRLP